MVDKNPSDDNGYTPLHSAANKGHLDVVKYLVQRIQNKNPKSGIQWYERTPLHQAAWNGHLNVVRYLLEIVPQDKDLKSSSGKTPSDYAEENGHTDIVEFLNSFQPPRK